MGYIGNNPKAGYSSSEIDSKIDSLSQNGSPLDSRYYTEPEVDSAVASVDLSTKQDTLVSGTNIKTVNGESVLGNGDIPIVGVVADYQEFTTSGTWTKPDGINYVYVEAWGGGGSGTRSTSAVTGGGGGAYVNKLIKAIDVSSSEIVTIGAGGVGVTALGSGNDGGNSTFGSLVTAKGGKSGGSSGNYKTGFGGSGAASGQTTSIHSTGDYSSGAGGGTQRVDGADSVKGGAGGGGSSGSQVGIGGVSIDGGNGGSASVSLSGENGYFPSGGGGSSASSNSSHTGGNGGNGRVRVWCW